MRRVKFTLGLMLAMLLLGANVMNAALEPAKPGAKYENYDTSPGASSDTIVPYLGYYVMPIGLSIGASPSYADTVVGSNNNIRYGYYIRGGSNASLNGEDTRNLPTLPTSDIDYNGDGNPDNIDLRFESYSLSTVSGTSQQLHSIPILGGSYSYNAFDTLLKYGASLTQCLEVDLAYDKGKEIIPFVKRTIVLGNWMYDTKKEINVWVESGHTVEELLSPVKRDTVTDFAYGSGVAKYYYNSEILSKYTSLAVHSIHYELWTNDEIGSTDAGNAPVSINRPVTIEAAAGISTNANPISGEAGVVQIPTGTDFTFEVYGEAGKELVVTTTSSRWSVANGGVKVVPNGSGKWTVTLSRVRATMTVKLEYAAMPESGAGDGTTGNDGSFEDKVWGSAGTLYVKSAGEGTLSIYSITGQLSKTVVVNGDYTTTMPKGLYIVQFKGKAYKVIL